MYFDCFIKSFDWSLVSLGNRIRETLEDTKEDMGCRPMERPPVMDSSASIQENFFLSFKLYIGLQSD